MKFVVTSWLFILLFAVVPVKAGAQEISVIEEKNFASGSYGVMVTAGTVGVAASAGLLLISNRDP